MNSIVSRSLSSKLSSNTIVFLISIDAGVGVVEYVLVKYASTESPSDDNERASTTFVVSVGSADVPLVVTTVYPLVDDSLLFSVTEYVPKGTLLIVYVAIPVESSKNHPVALPSIVAISDVPLFTVNDRYCFTSDQVLLPETFL